MTEITKIIELAEHPERFSEEQMTEILSDEENLKLYLTISETIEALGDASAASLRMKKETAAPRLAPLLWTAAAALLLIAFGATLKFLTGNSEPAPTEIYAAAIESPKAEEPAPAATALETEVPRPAPTVRAKRRRPAAPTTAAETEALVTHQLELQQARVDNEIARARAEAILAEYYAQQIAAADDPLADDNAELPTAIMALVME